VSVESQDTQVLHEAWAAFAESDWERARELFEAALQSEQTAEALDGLGQALFWLGEEEHAVELRTKAFGIYRSQDNREAAANVAVYIAGEYRIAGNASLADGWLGRATRLLEGCADCPGRGWLHIERAKRAAAPDVAEAEAREALGVAQRIGEAGLECAALGHLGAARIALGDVDEGMQTLNEAMAIATGAEQGDPLAIGDACCTALSACERLADPQRALDWGRAIHDFFRRRRFLPLLSWCRSVYAGFLVATGRWDDAERELHGALADEEALPNPRRAATLMQLGDLRLRQGRMEEAARLIEGLEDRPAALRVAVPLLIARGETDLAAEKIERRLEQVRPSGDPAAEAEVQCLHAEIALSRPDAAAARDATEKARRSAARAGRDDLRAQASVLAARSSQLAGDVPKVEELESAIECFIRLGLVLEEAEARVELARALAPEHSRLAIEQGQSALKMFERLGASRHADDAAALLRELGAPGRPAPRTEAELTRREQQVLELLGEGLSNPQIAERLVISPRTAEHHVRSILQKLDLKNRAEAAARAALERASRRP
jgi:DNA-binding CsgD family transcriptional regulator